jgi:hypothetical protein
MSESQKLIERDLWEYRILDLAMGDSRMRAQHDLDCLGEAGWELVAVSVQFTTHFAWLKRRLNR